MAASATTKRMILIKFDALQCFQKAEPSEVCKKDDHPGDRREQLLQYGSVSSGGSSVSNSQDSVFVTTTAIVIEAAATSRTSLTG